MQSGPPIEVRNSSSRRPSWRNRVVQPLVMRLVDIVLGAERPLVEHALGALVDDGALVARERHAVLVVLEEVLAHLGPDLLQQEAQMCRDRIVAQNCVPGLEEVVQSQNRKTAGESERDRQDGQLIRHAPCEPSQDQRAGKSDTEQRVARPERQQQQPHVFPRVAGHSPHVHTARSVAVLRSAATMTDGLFTCLGAGPAALCEWKRPVVRGAPTPPGADATRPASGR